MTAGVRICSSPEMVQELLKIGLIKVLLISEDVPYEKRKQIFTGKRIILPFPLSAHDPGNFSS